MSLNTVKIPPSPFVMIKPEFPLWLFPHAWPAPNEILIYHMICCYLRRYYLSFFYCILRRSTQQDRPLRAPVIKIGSYDPSWGLDIKFSTSKSRASFRSHEQRHCPKRKDSPSTSPVKYIYALQRLIVAIDIWVAWKWYRACTGQRMFPHHY